MRRSGHARVEKSRRGLAGSFQSAEALPQVCGARGPRRAWSPDHGGPLRGAHMAVRRLWWLQVVYSLRGGGRGLAPRGPVHPDASPPLVALLDGCRLKSLSPSSGSGRARLALLQGRSPRSARGLRVALWAPWGWVGELRGSPSRRPPRWLWQWASTPMLSGRGSPSTAASSQLTRRWWRRAFGISGQHAGRPPMRGARSKRSDSARRFFFRCARAEPGGLDRASTGARHASAGPPNQKSQHAGSGERHDAGGRLGRQGEHAAGGTAASAMPSQMGGRARAAMRTARGSLVRSCPGVAVL